MYIKRRSRLWPISINTSKEHSTVARRVVKNYSMIESMFLNKMNYKDIEDICFANRNI